MSVSALLCQMSNPFYFISRPHHSPHLFISLSVLLCVLLSGTVIITSRSSNSFDSVSLTDPPMAVLHAATNSYLINLSLQVQLGESDKLGNLQCSALLNVYRKDEQGTGGGWQVLAALGSDRLKVIRLKKKYYRYLIVTLFMFSLQNGASCANTHTR